MFTIRTPLSYDSERRYILSVMFSEFLGLEICVDSMNRTDTLVTIDGVCELLIADKLFSFLPDQWLCPSSLPTQPLKIWDTSSLNISPVLVDSKVPIVYGSHVNSFGNFCQIEANSIELGLDIFGSCFFMLTRYEEIVNPCIDQHRRFPAKESLAFQENFLERPLVNEYLEILWSCLKKLWPRLERKQRQFKILPSHDVDQPFKYFLRSAKYLSKEIAGDIIKRRKIKSTPKKIANVVYIKFGNYRRDPYYTFDWLMEQSEKYDTQSTFYFMACNPGPFDKGYSIFKGEILNLLKEIDSRGHNIGLHPSYESYENPHLLRQEMCSLSDALQMAGISNSSFGSRQHYLRWQPEKHWSYLSDIGMTYDSTLGFPELPGFRTGSCYEYSTFDVLNRKHLPIKEKPLILMDCTIVGSPIYMNLTELEAINIIGKIYSTIQKFDGDFVWLWHNSSLEFMNEDFYSHLFVDD